MYLENFSCLLFYYFHVITGGFFLLSRKSNTAINIAFTYLVTKHFHYVRLTFLCYCMSLNNINDEDIEVTFPMMRLSHIQVHLCIHFVWNLIPCFSYASGSLRYEVTLCKSDTAAIRVTSYTFIRIHFSTSQKDACDFDQTSVLNVWDRWNSQRNKTVWNNKI